MPLFGKSTKSPTELVKTLQDALSVVERGDSKKLDKALEDVSKSLVSIKNMFYGTNDQQQNESLTDIAAAQLAQEIYNSNLLSTLINNLTRIEFEAKKDVAQIFSSILRKQIGTRSPTVEYICTKPDIIFTLIRGYEKHEISLNCGLMLRECARHETLTKIVLQSSEFYLFFRYVELPTFEIASDAFSTFKELLTRHKHVTARFLESDYEQFFAHYQKLLNSDNYVTKRQSLILLGELIKDKHQDSTQGKTSRLSCSSFGDLLQIFVLNSFDTFVTKVHNPTMLDDQVEMCKRIMNIYRYMVMKIYMNTATWQQLLNVMLSITEHLFPSLPPKKKESTIGGRIAPAFFQTFIVSWIRANLYVHISTQMWNEFHRVMQNLIRWRELIEEWSTTMSSLTRVLVKNVYGLNLVDLPLEKPQDRFRRPKAIKSFSTAEAMLPNNPATHSIPNDSVDSPNNNISTQSGGIGEQLRRGSIKNDHKHIVKGLTRSNSDGIVVQSSPNLYYSSANPVGPKFGRKMRKIKSEYLLFDIALDLSSNRRSSSILQNDVIDGTSLREPKMIIDNDHVIDPSGRTPDSISMKSNKKLDQKTSSEKCVLLGGSVRGWTAENSVIMWRRMLGIFGNINQIEDPENHLVAIRCLAVILCDFIKTRENLGISIDNRSTPEQPSLIPPYTYQAGWLLEATHLPSQFKESQLTAFKLLCLMSIRKHDIELPLQFYSSLYEALHRGLNSSDPTIHATIIKNSTQLLSLELPGCTLLVQDLYERSRSILLYASKELPINSLPRDQAIQILNTILALYKPIKKLMVLNSEQDNSINLVALKDMKTKIFDAFLTCNSRPVVLDYQTRSHSLCSMAIHVYQELYDKYDSLSAEKLFDTLLIELQDSNNANLFCINCDLVRLFANHAQTLVQNRPTLVSSVLQIICQLIVRLSTNESNKDAINNLLICLEDWCIAVGNNFLLKSVDQLSIDEDDTLSASLNESLMTIIFRSLEIVINDEQYIDDQNNKTNKGSTSISKGSDTQSNSQVSISSDGKPRDRTMTNEPKIRFQQNEQLPETLNVQAIKTACRVTQHKLITYLGHFPFKQIGAASLACCTNESDFLTNMTERGDLKNVNLLVIDGRTIVTFIGANMNNNNQNLGPIHIIVRNLCGKYVWDTSCLDLELMQHSSNEQDSITVDRDSFRQGSSRSSMKDDSDFNDECNPGNSLNSRSSFNRDYVDDLLNQLTSLVSSGSLTSSSQSSYKRRNCAQSISNSKYKVAQAEETMMALLTNQRFQEYNYCEEMDDMDRVAINFGFQNKFMNDKQNQSSPNSNLQQQLISEQCRQLVQQLGFLSWQKRAKVDSLSKSVGLIRELKNLDAEPCRETHKIAVIYVANGQEDKISILANNSGSRAFEDFVSGLAWEVNLSNHLGFKGGLESNKSTGETSPYYCNSTTEVIFHVSTRIPTIDDESLNRKMRHLGNDEIHIIWSEHTRDYRRGIIPTQFSDVIIAIYPMLTFQGYYRIQISCKPDVPIFGPLYDNCIIHQTSLASLVRATAINANRAIKRLKMPYSHYEGRSRLIETIVQNHSEKLSFEDFAVQLYQTNVNQETSCCN